MHQLSFSYRDASYETVSCNLCGSDRYEVLDTRDQRGLPARTCICASCGLLYLNPRMTKEWYGKYYEHEYAVSRRRYDRRADETDLDLLFQKSKRSGIGLARLFAPYLLPGFTIEVGSGVGGVLAGFQEILPDFKGLGIEPSAQEVFYANAHGIRTYQALFENFAEPLPKAKNIVAIRSLNHLLDPKKFFVWAYHQLVPDGRLALAVLDFRHSAKKRGSIKNAVQIDHPFMFTSEVLREFVKAAGFDMLFFETNEEKPFREMLALKSKGLTSSHIRLVARKSSRLPFDPSYGIAGHYPAVRRSLHPFFLRLYWVRYILFRIKQKMASRFL